MTDVLHHELPQDGDVGEQAVHLVAGNGRVHDAISLDRRSSRAAARESSLPANAGAHRLAWWIAGQADGDAAYADLASCGSVPVSLVDRLISGAVEPSAHVAAAVERVTDGAVTWVDWSLPADGGWDERPSPRGRA